MLSVRTRSAFGWLFGAALGAVTGALIVPNKRSTIRTKTGGAIWGALAGAGLIGMINDKRLESDPNYTGGS